MHPQTSTLRLAVFPAASLATDAVLILGGALLIAGSAQISYVLPFTPVPITGQTFAVLLVGASLGAARGGLSALAYVLMGLMLPFYAGHHEGWAIITGASGGYLLSYPIVAALTGYLAEQRWDRRFSSAIGLMLTGNVLIYLIALPWLAVVLHADFNETLRDGLYPFIPGDMLKLYIAAAALPAAWRLVQRTRR